MSITRILLALALPLSLTAGCALDVGSSTDELRDDRYPNDGLIDCGRTVQRWLEVEWPVETIVAGDMEFTRADLTEYLDTSPGDRATMIGELAATQLNMALGFEVPDTVLGGVITVDEWIMAPDNDGYMPPPVAIEGFEAISGFNSELERDCFYAPTEVQDVPGYGYEIDDSRLPRPVGSIPLSAIVP